MNDNWIKIYVTNNYQKAQLIKMRLEENGINTVDINKKDSMYLFGDIELYVDKINFIKAKDVIKEIENE